MFAKVFSQIFDSSIAENYTVRHVFMDFLVLADSSGAVDMTITAIQRRTGVPMEMLTAAIKELEAADPESRSKEAEGRRLVPLDSGRSWGWRIVNYEHYRQIQTESARKEYFRNYRAKWRERQKSEAKGIEQNVNSAECSKSSAMQRQKEKQKEDTSVVAIAPPPVVAGAPDIPENLNVPLFLEAWEDFLAYRRSSKWKKFTKETIAAKFKQFSAYGPTIAAEALRKSIEHGWQGVFPEQIVPQAPQAGKRPLAVHEEEKW